LGLYPYEHSIQALKGINHYLHNRGVPMAVPLSEIIIDHRAIHPLGQNTFQRELGRALRGVPTRISFYHDYETISIPNWYLFLGSIDLKIEADLIIRDNKFTLTNVEVVGGCDKYDASMQKRPALEHAITRVLSIIPGTPYVIELKGRQALPDMEGEVPLDLPAEAKPPECVQSEQR
jgi:hypothetical protein